MGKGNPNPKRQPGFEKHPERINRNGNKALGIITDIKQYVREKLAEPTTEGGDVTKLEALTQKLLRKAYEGDTRALEIVLAYGYGKPSQQIDMSLDAKIQETKTAIKLPDGTTIWI